MSTISINWNSLLVYAAVGEQGYCDVPHWFDEEIASALTPTNTLSFAPNTSVEAANEPNFKRVAT